RVLGPRGRAGFTAHVTHVTRNVPPGTPQPRDQIEVNVPALRADSITPSFLMYELDDVSCSFQFANRVLTVKDLQAAHGASGRPEPAGGQAGRRLLGPIQQCSVGSLHSRR